VKYARIDNGSIAEYPLNEGTVRQRFPNVSWPASGFVPPDGYAAVQPTVLPVVTWNQRIVAGQPVFTNGEWVESWVVETLDAAEQAAKIAFVKEAKRTMAAVVRWQKEINGTVYGGYPLATDNISQTKYLGALIASQLNPNITIKWKLANGNFVTLNATTISNVTTKVREYIQSCFDREAELIDLINAAATPDDVEVIDLSTGWPT
jgi:hypothetical protein